jgi:hypothetical protein
MVNTPELIPKIRSRQITESDLGRIVGLLKKGFGLRRSRGFWDKVIERLIRHASPAGLPKYGYMLESDGEPVGVILQIFSTMPAQETAATRCSVSSWYVDPRFRSYASLLAAQALKHKNVTYLNVSSAPNTRPIVEAQGYARYADGVFAAIPLLSRAQDDAMIVPVQEAGGLAADDAERAMLLEHAEYGCLSFWCVASGQAFPFVLRPRSVKGIVPCAQLIYCRDIADLARFARPIGKFLLRRGIPFVVIDANGPIPELVGHYFAGTMPKYFRGPLRPRLGDLAYTETALFGL